MASPSASQVLDSSKTRRQLERARERYQYRPAGENQLAPVATAKKWPWLTELYAPSWWIPYAPVWLAAAVDKWGARASFRVERLLYRFDKLAAYGQLFPARRPAFAELPEDDDAYDAAFAWWRIAGANPLLLRREDDLRALCARIALDVPRIEARLATRLGRRVDLDQAARAGRLFAVDFQLLQSVYEANATTDSRWREKYLPAPIGVFLEAPGMLPGCDLVPLAIQVQQPQPVGSGAHNPVHYPDDRWGWRIARSYFEAADVSFQAAVGHLFGAHLVMEPFCMATARRLSRRHKVRSLLAPHLRYTLVANGAAYDHLVDRSKIYAEIYSASIENLRALIVQRYLGRGFTELGFEADLVERKVEQAPADYPYRDDMRLWIAPVREFVTSYVQNCYAGDAAVRDDGELQDWADELVHEDGGAVRMLVPGGALDTRAKLVDLLAQLLLIAGPGHAAQHFTATYFYRYAPLFPAGVYEPPPGPADPVDRARWQSMLPPLAAAAHQFQSNTHTDYRYRRFGSYWGYRLDRLPEAREPIRRLKQALAQVETTIAARQPRRLFRYDFLLPSRVPNSVNI
jgi:arachidonate 15-lipoxygenase